MDPFTVIDSSLNDLILQHFKASEVLRGLSLVSPKWSKIAGKSETCMNKVEFAYQAHCQGYLLYGSKEVFQCALNSWRNYQHVMVVLGKYSPKFWRFMELRSPSIRSLKLKYIVKSVEEDFNVNFPNLETFIALETDNETLKTVLKSTTKLKSLFIVSRLSSMSCEFFIESLQRNPTLVFLYLNNVNFESLFEKEFPFIFALKSLTLISKSAMYYLSSTAEKNLMKFLKQQSKSLKTFYLQLEGDEISNYSLNHLPALISLLKCPTADIKPIETSESTESEKRNFQLTRSTKK